MWCQWSRFYTPTDHIDPSSAVSRAITGPGLDAELDAGDVAARCGARCRNASSHRWEASRLPHSSPSSRGIHRGHRPVVPCRYGVHAARRHLRPGCARRALPGCSAALCTSARRTCRNRIAQALLHTHSLYTAEEAVTRLNRTSEIDNERRKQTQLQPQGASTRTSTPTMRLASCQMSPPVREGAAFGS
jgi:hypothetical protein